ncbi:DUF6289 family protein [Luteimonas sp. RD2P54]|uniref:DUF6289 family protein n=1 Tax=Luteimonas endophytica TaxID=3042023 RepID=A0ABT6JAP0_9GAMM|nr:DUF6289 family protein [Luteimonas endophytica]MDH5823887.1 DUF6289 family protein [Luteimonas endophytica]
MRRHRCLYASLALAALAAASLVHANGFPGVEAYYDDDGRLVGEATFGCVPNQSWGIVTDNVVVRAGCGVSQ